MHIITICEQSLKNIKGATRAYNMYRALEKAGVKVTYLDGWKPAIKIKYRNIRNWLRLFIFFLHSKKSKYIFIENVMNPLYLKIIKSFGLPIVIDIRDDLNLHAEAMGVETSKKQKLQRVLSNIENFEVAEIILVPSESYRNYYLKNYEISSEKIISVPNATDINIFNVFPLPKTPIIGLVGGMNKGQGFDLLLEAALICKKTIPNLMVKCAYDCIIYTEQYKTLLKKKYALDWIEFREDVFYTKNSSDFIGSLSVFVISLSNNLHHHMSTPTKLYDSMAAGRPIVVTNIKESAQIVKEEKCGLVCDFTPNDMAKKILILLSNRKLSQEMCLRGRTATEERHNWNVRVKVILDKLQNSRT